jgi:predicted short-subunit dehydrogenase-like oxidoreductase (DUF2520 family)
MISVVLLGTGNVSKNLFESFLNSDEIDVLRVAGRSEKGLVHFKNRAETSTDWNALPKADIYILAINDDAIAEVSKNLMINGLIVHTSGSVPVAVLADHSHSGVLYPLQTFTSDRIIDLDKVPFCLEAKDPTDLDLLQKFAQLLSNHVVHISSEKRKVLHLAAVFVNNFTNHMYTIANDISETNDLDFDLLKPLIKETVSKLDYLSPAEAQTGPAKRGDLKTLHGHLDLLKDSQHREIYKLMSNAIKASYGKKL